MLLKQFKTLFPYLARYKRRYAAGLCCLIAVDAAQILIPQWTRAAINVLQRDSFIWNDVFKYCIAMVSGMAVIALGRFLWRYFIHGASRFIEAELRETLFAHLLTLDSSFYQKNKTGDIMARSINDIGAVRMAVGWGLVGGIDGTVMAAVILAVMFIQAPTLAALTIIPVPFITLAIALFGRAVGRRFRRAQESYSSMSDFVREAFLGSRVIKSFVREETFIKRFENVNDDYIRANMSVVRVHGLFFPLIIFLAGILTLIMMFFGAREVARGSMQAGDLVALIAYIHMLVWPMFGAGFTVNMLQRGAVSLERINEVLNTKSEIKDIDAKVELSGQPALRGEGVEWPERVGAANGPEGVERDSAPLIEIRNLSFTYPDGKEALHNINLQFERGEWIGIFGKTGSGKSTLIKILPRLLEAPSGTVFIKGVDIRERQVAELRSLFAVAPQDGFLFSDSIKNNIIYGLPEAEVLAGAVAEAAAGNGAVADGLNEGALNEGRLKGVISLAALERDLSLFAQAEETLIGERGLTLSGGQKQRVTIGRAAIMESEILILDDAFSACDAETEKNIIKNLEKARKGKTTIIVSHRVSAFRSASKVAVLEGGALSDFAAPSELLARGGYFAKTARLQQLDSPAKKLSAN